MRTFYFLQKCFGVKFRLTLNRKWQSFPIGQ
uniref:Uncharacterized protein n=1 Tax=Anguilla anguilla TaxID=7936 RepID=A0A0E9UMV9_ANGAN